MVGCGTAVGPCGSKVVFALCCIDRKWCLCCCRRKCWACATSTESSAGCKASMVIPLPCRWSRCLGGRRYAPRLAGTGPRALDSYGSRRPDATSNISRRSGVWALSIVEPQARRTPQTSSALHTSTIHTQTHAYADQAARPHRCCDVVRPGLAGHARASAHERQCSCTVRVLCTWACKGTHPRTDRRCSFLSSSQLRRTLPR